MAFTNYLKNSITSEASKKTLASGRSVVNKPDDSLLFYELEPAVVVDVIRDETHSVFKDKKTRPLVSPEEFPEGFNDPLVIDYASWIGRARIRMLYSETKLPIDQLSWAIPLESGIKEFPLINEVVIVSRYMKTVYYSRRLNDKNFINNNADYRHEIMSGDGTPITRNKSDVLSSPRNKSNVSYVSNQINSHLGKYFKANNMIRPLRHYEGDTILESRFGSSIRFGNFVDSPSFDIGSSSGHGESYSGNLGNPMILIRNRQRPLIGSELQYGHTILEDINRDGSSIQLTSGRTLSKFTHTLGRSLVQPKRVKNPGISASLGSLSNSSIGTKKIKSKSSPSNKKTEDIKEVNNTNDLVVPDESHTTQQKMAEHASKGDHGSAMTSGLQEAIGDEDGGVVGGRLGKMDSETASKFVETPNSNNGTNLVSGSANSGVSVETNMASTGGSKKGSLGTGALLGAGIAISGGLTKTGGSSVSSSSIKRANFLGDIGSGNFKLNQTFETGIIGSVAGSNKVAQNVLGGTPAGSALSAASSLGIDVPGLSDIGIKSEDSFMFKIFKLASMGILAICGLLDKKKGTHGSKTEESLGWLLSFGINIALLGILMSIFDKLRNLKFALGFLLGFSLKDFLFDLCDFVNQIEWGNSLTGTLDTELSKLATQQLGSQMKNDGTYGAYAKNHTDFDQQFSALGSDFDDLGASLKGGGGVSGFASLQKGNEEVATMTFDPMTGLYRDKDGTSQSSGNGTLQQSSNSGNIGSSGISYQTDSSSGIQYNQGGVGKLGASFGGTISGGGSKPTTVNSNGNPTKSVELQSGTQLTTSHGSTITNSTKTTQVQANSSVTLASGSTLETRQDIKNGNNPATLSVPAGTQVTATPGSKIETPSGKTETLKESSTIKTSEKTEITNPNQTSSKKGVSYETDTSGVEYNTDGVDDNERSKSNKTEEQIGGEDSEFSKNNDSVSSGVRSKKTQTTKPNNVTPTPQDPDEVKSFHTGETITRESLKGTPIENADMNAVSLLHPEDLDTLKDTDKVNNSIQQAKQAKKKNLNSNLSKLEKKVLKEASEAKVIFGKQLPALTGNQIIINSERILISSKTQETGIYAKKKFFVATDDEITMNCIDRFVTETKTHTSVISPTIHLGAYITRRHPVLKGNNTIDWLSALCGWLSSHVHHDPYITTSRPAQQGSLANLRSRLPTLLSTRVFIDG
jgi:hypothetical protein